ncbi:putative tape measure protein [Tsukamurella phage TPA4]|uniref:tail length tape measure protein n=1 Tax=Tsukamurella phage TPA4 TaxID=1647476 RepID=UPI0007B655CC|nr:tail length tape measure protein [Tsukamurella phage TPA4]AKJ72182.1 putative tape measure protein [Tsukamurella phage TPA4]
MAELATAWITVAANTGGMQRDIRRAVNSAERGAKVRVDADTDPFERSVDRALARVSTQSRSAGSKAGREFGLSFSREMKVATAAVAAGSLPAVSSALAGVAGALQQVSQAALLIPGGMAAAGASFGTLRLGTIGMADAIKDMWAAAESGDPKDLKKAAEALKGVSPNAKSAITALGSLHDSYTKLKNTVQDNMFAGTDRGLKELASKSLPTVTAGLEKTSKAWGATFREILRVGGDTSTLSIVDRIFGNTADAQTRANRAIAPLVSALGQLAATGTDSLPGLADGLTGVSQRFNSFITTTSADGRLHQWIGEGIDGLGHLGGTALNVGKTFTAITQAAGSNGLLRSIDEGTNRLQKFLNSAEGQSKMGAFFDQGKDQLRSWAPILQSIPTILNSVYGAFTTVVLPKIASVATFLAEHATLVKTAAIAWLAFHTVPTIMAGIRQRITAATTAVAANAAAARTGAAAYTGFGGAIRQAAGANRLLVSSTGAVLSSGQQLGGHIRNANNGAAAMARSMGQSAVQFGRFGSAVATVGQRVPVIASMQQAFVRGATSAERFGRTAGAIQAGGQLARSSLTGLRTAASGAMGVLGGPFGVAMVAGGLAVMGIAKKNRESAQSFDDLQRAIKGSEEAQSSLNKALQYSNGESSEDVQKAAGDRIAAMKEQIDAASKRTGSFLDMFRDEGREGTRNAQIERQAKLAGEAKTALDNLKLGNEQLAASVYGSQSAFDTVAAKLNSMGAGGQEAVRQLAGVRTEFLRQQGAAASATPGITAVSDAMKVLGDRTASATDKTSALKTALDALNPSRSKEDAVAAHTKALAGIDTSSPVDQSKGYGAGLLTATGINASLENGVQLREELMTIRDVTAAVTLSVGGDLSKMTDQTAANEKKFAELAQRYGVSIDQLKARAQIGDIQFIVGLSGGAETTRQLAAVAEAFRKTPDKKSVTINADSVKGAEDRIRSLGFAITDELGPDGQKTGNVVITATTDQAKTRLVEVMTLASQVPPGKNINFAAPGAQAVIDLLNTTGAGVRNIPGTKDIEVTSPTAPGVQQLMETLGFTVKNIGGVNVLVRQEGAEQTQTDLGKTKAAVDAIPAYKKVVIEQVVEAQAKVYDPGKDHTVRPGMMGSRLHGAVVPMLAGGLRWLSSKPRRADIYAGRGAGTVFAEEQTGGEAYIPFAASNRARSVAILGETARLFGLQVINPSDVFNRYQTGGISVDDLKAYASSIEGGRYGWGGGNGDTLTDTDCSGAQAAIVNKITGASGRFHTGNQAEALAARGFIMGDPPAGVAAYAVGWVNGGPGGGHTSGTIIDPEGGNVNVEMGGARGNGQYGGGAAAASSFPNRAYILLQGQDMTDSGSTGTGSSSGSGSSKSYGGGGFGSVGTAIAEALFGSRGSGSGSGSGSGGGSGSGSSAVAARAVDPKKLRDAQQKVTDKEAAAALAQTKLNETLNNPKAKESARQAARDRLTIAQREAADAKTDLETLKAGGTSTASKVGGASAKQIRDAEQKVADKEAAARRARTQLAEARNNPKAKKSMIQAAEDRLTVAEREAADAKTDLETLKNKGTTKSGDGTKTDGSNTSEFQSLGQNLVSGMFQAIGLDGSLFSNPFEWPNFKSAIALLNWGGGVAKSLSGSDSENMGGLVGGAAGGLGLTLPGIGDFMKPIDRPAMPAAVMPGGPLPLQQDRGGNTTNNYTISGVNPTDMLDKVRAQNNAAFRRQGGALTR